MNDALQKGVDLLQKEIRTSKINLSYAEKKGTCKDIEKLREKIEAKQAVVDHILGVAE